MYRFSSLRWLCWGILLTVSFRCTQHSKFSENKEAYDECLGETPDAKTLEKIRKEIHADEKKAKLEEVFRKRKNAGFNGSVLVAQKGVILYEKTFGYANVSRKDTLTTNTAFQLASLSKPFTAIAVLKLYEAGKISLEDSVQQFFPEFPYPGVRIRHLLCHRTGLPSYTSVFTDSVRKHNRYPANGDILRWFAVADPAPKPFNHPDRFFSYSNTNYLILASIVEKVSGIPFAEFVRKYVLDPLRMEHSFVCTNPRDSVLVTTGHQYRRPLPKDNYDNVVGDKGLYSTTRDLYRFSQALFQGCILQKKTLEEAFTPRSFERKSVRNYGYGFRMHVDEKKKPRYIYHGGWWKGYNTMWWVSPEDDFVIIVLGNYYNRSVYQMKELLDIMHGEDQGPMEDDTL